MPLFIEWVPTCSDEIDGYFELAPLTPSDVVYDLGAGDGRVLFAALSKGAGKAVGIEFSRKLIQKTKKTARSTGANGTLTLLKADIMDVNLADASVVLVYLCPEAYPDLKPKFESELRPGTRVVTQAFDIPGWKPTRTLRKIAADFYLYTMPPEKVP